MRRVMNKPIKTRGGREARYRGDVDESGRPHGYGEYRIVEHDQFESQVNLGMFEDGLFQGTGKAATEDGEECIGQWVDGHLNGVGYHEWSNGHRFSGQFSDHKMHGLGEYAWRDGHRYIGWFVDDIQHGAGLLVYADGSKAAVECQLDAVVSETRGSGILFSLPSCFISIGAGIIILIIIIIIIIIIICRSKRCSATRERNQWFACLCSSSF
jgi:hypothetical protein